MNFFRSLLFSFLLCGLSSFSSSNNFTLTASTSISYSNGSDIAILRAIRSDEVREREQRPSGFKVFLPSTLGVFYSSVTHRSANESQWSEDILLPTTTHSTHLSESISSFN